MYACNECIIIMYAYVVIAMPSLVNTDEYIYNLIQRFYNGPKWVPPGTRDRTHKGSPGVFD